MVIYRPSLNLVYNALASDKRRTIMDALAVRTRTVLELARLFDVSQPAVTKHLNVLEQAGLIERIKQGRRRYCRIKPEVLEGATEWIDRCRNSWDDSFAALETFLEEE